MTLFKETTAALQKKLDISNTHAVPRIEKVIVQTGVGKNRDNERYLEAVKNDLKRITGQAPAERRARKSVAGFSVREGNLVGYQVTLRGKRMEDFVTRFIGMTLPRVRDFRGVPLSVFDGRGNLSVGLREQLPFPEIQADQTDVVFGVQVTFATSADTDEEGKTLFRALGFPLTTQAGAQLETELDTREKRAAREKGKGSVAKAQPTEAAT